MPLKPPLIKAQFERYLILQNVKNFDLGLSFDMGIKYFITNTKNNIPHHPQAPLVTRLIKKRRANKCIKWKSPMYIIPLTGNGRMSEAQAAMALLSLDDYPKNRERNKTCFELYDSILSDVPGIRLLHPSEDIISNYQYVVMEVFQDEFGLSRDGLHKILHAENIACRKYFSPGIHRTIPFLEDVSGDDDFPHTDQLCERIMQLPSGQHINTDSINMICDIIKIVRENASKLNALHG